MPSSFSWLDYSEAERRKMLDVIELFGERTTRDELGIGGIRDAFADLLFPGTTTIQTVAKYFLFVPWMYLQLEKKQTSSATVKERARKFEIELAKQLGDADGAIGRRAKENLQRLPSSVYWQGLLSWGIRSYPGSQSDYHRSLDLFYVRRKGRASSGAEFDGEGAHEAILHNWHDGLGQLEPDAFPEGATLELTPDEAAYLRERVMTSCADSLLAYLLRYRVDVDGVEFAWQLGIELPESLGELLHHGQNFSEMIHGAQLLYNLILAEQTKKADRVTEYRELLDQWWETVESRRSSLRSWDQVRFWTTVYRVNPRITSRAKSFVQSWIDLVLASPDQSAVTQSKRARHLIESREFQIKKTLARTRNQRARELWSGAAGSAQLDLRWRTSRRIISDILQGLEAKVDA